MKLQRIKICIIVICMFSAGICYSCSQKRDVQELSLAAAAESPKAQSEAELQPESVQETVPEALCYVHICGEVNVPGVYEVNAGERIYKVIELAGGFTEHAATEYLNMAQTVEDGMKLVVPSILEVEGSRRYGQGEVSPEGSAVRADSKININTASKEQLMTLKGIGESRAEDIIRFREEQGRFEKTEDIMKVPGIKDAAFAKIKDSITV